MVLRSGGGGGGWAPPAVAVNLSLYFTSFAGSEGVLSEGGIWLRHAPDIFNNPVQKLNGAAFDGGSASAVNDALAYVSPAMFVPSTRVRLTSTLKVNGTIGAGEVEHHFNGTSDATNVRLYEADLGSGGVFGVAKWRGSQGNVLAFLTHLSGSGSWVSGPVSGDKLISERTISGGVVHFDLFHVPLSSGTKTFIYSAEDDGSDSAIYTTGQPGIGFDNGAIGGGSNGNFAFDDFQAENF